MSELQQSAGLNLGEIERAIESGHAMSIARGYQGAIYLYETNGVRYVIKAALGRGVLRILRTAMLRNEFASYQRLHGFAGSPRCDGLVGGKYLVLEYVEAESARHAVIVDPELFFDIFLRYIGEMHERGVAHGDLKRKDNVLVVQGKQPCIIDFGTAIRRKDGFAPINHFLFGLARQTDLNGWIKLKYRKRMSEISAADRVYYRRMISEVVVRETRRLFKHLRRGLFRSSRR